MVSVHPFTAPGVGDACLCHQVTFVGGVDEHRGPEYASNLRPDFTDVSALQTHAALFFQPALIKHSHIPGLLDHFMKHCFGNMWLRVPLNLALIVSPKSFIKFESITADGFLLAVIGCAEPAGDHPAELISRFQQGNT